MPAYGCGLIEGTVSATAGTTFGALLAHVSALPVNRFDEGQLCMPIKKQSAHASTLSKFVLTTWLLILCLL